MHRLLTPGLLSTNIGGYGFIQSDDLAAQGYGDVFLLHAMKKGCRCSLSFSLVLSLSLSLSLSLVAV